MLPRTSPESFLADNEVSLSAPCAASPERAASSCWQRVESGIVFAVVAAGTLGSWCAGTWLMHSWLFA